MPLNNKTAVIGSAIHAPVTGDARSLEEILYDVVQAALRDAGIRIDDIDGLVCASNDQFDGRAISVMAASGSIGGVDRDILSTPSASEHAFVMGVLRIASGQYRTQLVVSWSPLEAHSLSAAQRLEADPYFHRRLPLDDLSAFALQASALGAKTPEVHDIARALAASHGGGADGPDPRRWPLQSGMVGAPATGAVALVLASEAFAAERAAKTPAWVRGMGWATEPGFLGDRDLSTAPALVEAARLAFADSGTRFDVAEIADATPYQTLLALEALGLSKRADWASDIASGAFGPKGRLPVNPSGGAQKTNAVYCTGLMRIAEAAEQVRGQARNQISNVKTALAHAASGFAMQYQTVVVLGQDR
jgi:acetyl-CoA C-acetyltransferase